MCKGSIGPRRTGPDEEPGFHSHTYRDGNSFEVSILREQRKCRKQNLFPFQIVILRNITSFTDCTQSNWRSQRQCSFSCIRRCFLAIHNPFGSEVPRTQEEGQGKAGCSHPGLGMGTGSSPGGRGDCSSPTTLGVCGGVFEMVGSFSSATRFCSLMPKSAAGSREGAASIF